MEQLHENAERIWKVLSQFPQGATAKRLEQITSMRKSVTYIGLKELYNRGYIDHIGRLWVIKGKPSTESKKGNLTRLEFLLREDAAEDEIMGMPENEFTLGKRHEIYKKHGLL